MADNDGFEDFSDAICDIAEAEFLSSLEPELKRARTEEEEAPSSSIQAWAKLKPAAAGRRVELHITPKFWFTVFASDLPTANPFVELEVLFTQDSPPKLLKVLGARAVSTIPGKDFNIAASIANIAKRVSKNWTKNTRPQLQYSEVSHSPQFRVLCHEEPYFRVLVEYGAEYADQLTPRQLAALCSKNLLMPFLVEEVPEHLKFLKKPRSVSSAQWGMIESVVSTYRMTGKTGGYQTLPGLVDEEGQLIMAQRIHPSLRANKDLFKLVITHETDKPAAEHVSDLQFERMIAEGKEVTLYGDPEHRIVDPFLKHHFTGFRFLCSIGTPVVVPWDANNNMRHVHRALKDPTRRELFQGQFEFFRLVTDVMDWTEIKKHLRLVSTPPASQLILCANEDILRSLEQIVVPQNRVLDKKSITFDYSTLTTGEKLSSPFTSLLNLTTFTKCFCEPRDEVVMILCANFPRDLLAASVKLAKKKVTILFSPGTPRSERKL